MNIPPFWAKEHYTGADASGREQTFVACGWSFESLDKARAEALARAQRIFEAIAGGRRPKEYEYLDRPIREEIVQTIDVGQDEPVLITRNRYGALVLNTASVFFADVDCPPASPRGVVEALLWPFSPARRRRRREALREETLSRVRAWAAANSARRFRLYRTHSGLRLLFVDRTYEPGSPEVSDMLSELGADPLYRRLTEKQQCFRARLSPKPWRCGVGRPPSSYPWSSSADERAYRRWETEYTDACRGFRTAVLESGDGAAAEHPAIQRVIRLHDDWSCKAAELPLA